MSHARTAALCRLCSNLIVPCVVALPMGVAVGAVDALFGRTLLPALLGALCASATSGALGLEKFAVAFSLPDAIDAALLASTLGLGAVFGLVGAGFARLLARAGARRGRGVWLRSASAVLHRMRRGVRGQFQSDDLPGPAAIAPGALGHRDLGLWCPRVIRLRPRSPAGLPTRGDHMPAMPSPRCRPPRPVSPRAESPLRSIRRHDTVQCDCGRERKEAT